MKYSILLTLIFGTSPLYAGINCMDNSEHLEKPNDKKELHLVECYCKCEVIVAGICAECGHVQDAHPLIVIDSRTTKVIAKKLEVQLPKNLQDFLDNTVKPYLQNR